MIKAVSAFAIIAILLVPSIALQSAFGQSEAKYTILVYMVGSDLESQGQFATADINEMLAGGIDDRNVNLVPEGK
jgi:hypothetical protein